MMDNEAFRELVQERSKPKSTREIAREAVEEEFRRRRTKGKRKRSSSSSSEDNDSDRDDDDRKNQRKDNDDLNKLIPVAAQKKQQQKSIYRDRARERREGKSTDYAATKSMLEGVAKSARDGEMDATTLSKYLGGDEEHTHLVKGLDIALARKIKREMDKDGQEPDLETTLRESTRRSKQNASLKRTVMIQNADQARAFLKQANSEKDIATPFGRGMLQCLQRMYLPKAPAVSQIVQSPAGAAIQRSTLTFAATGHPGDRLRSWEVPMESTQSALHSAASSASKAKSSILDDRAMLDRIRLAFSSKDDTVQPAVQHGEKHEAITTGTGQDANVESDDDIFEDAGRYVPLSAQPTKNEAAIEKDDRVKKGSIFSGLDLPQKKAAAAVEESRLPSKSTARINRPQALHESGVIDRDVLGLRQSAAKISKPRNIQGVSVSAYEGGYGEDMDMDFDGGLANDEDEKGTKKKGKKKPEETTIASQEYGKGRGK